MNLLECCSAACIFKTTVVGGSVLDEERAEIVSVVSYFVISYLEYAFVLIQCLRMFFFFFFLNMYSIVQLLFYALQLRLQLNVNLLKKV